MAVAKAFSADPKLFTSRRGPQAAEAAGTLATRVLDLTAEELSRLIESCTTGGGESRRRVTAYRLTIAFFPMARGSPSAR